MSPRIEKTIARPSASSAYVEPSETPLTSSWISSVISRDSEIGRLHLARTAQLLREAGGRNLARAQDVRAIAQVERVVDVLVDQQHAEALLVPEAADQVENELDEERCQPQRRL